MVFPDVTLQLYQMHACLDRFESSGVPWLHCCGRALIDLGCFSHPLGDRSRGRNHCWCTISKSFLGNWGPTALWSKWKRLVHWDLSSPPAWPLGHAQVPTQVLQDLDARMGVRSPEAAENSDSLILRILLDTSPTVWSEGSFREAAYYINLYVYNSLCI